ncbi:MAG: hypothetical protein AAB531_01535 [Patescibacteria group bacterium]
MLTLNQATGMTKKLAIWIGVLLGTLVTIILLFRIGTLIKNIIAPTPPAPPSVAYGELPEMELPLNLDTKNYSYTIDTVTGELPKFSDRAKVFKITPRSTDLLALRKTGEKVSQAGFTSGPVRVRGNVYQWSDPRSPVGSKIKVDIFTSEFSISSEFFNDTTILSSLNLPSPDEARDLAQGLLSSMEALSEDIKNTQTYFFSIKGSELVSTTSFSDAHIIEVDFFQKDLDNLPIYYPQPYNSTMKVFIGGGENQPQIIQAQFFHQDISTESATYPIKTAEETYSELKDGKAYIASPGKGEVSLQNISLAYYMSDKAQEYLMPIVVFQGDNGFIAYLSAVKAEWINK